ncbi:PD-(D/E)XK nuclease-like domain-containing protein [Clostridioides mangenotii]|nr:PD-(D/E)XK nuclease-like domain-containing protein [Clostridioides mangenotii]MBU5308833.1 PD-(D/E)XK nuclease-like domain-containing protein [Clostridioides mangenotii]
MKLLQINKENYFSNEADREYFSVSQFKSFMSCEAKTVAKLNEEWVDGDDDAFILGSYVHAWSEGSNLDEFKAKHPQMFKKDGTLLAKYSIGDKMIETLKNDPLISKVREGEKEVILTVEMFGVMWKAMIDIYNPDKRYFADLKTTRDIKLRMWNEDKKQKENFIVVYDYVLQMAVYAELERINSGRAEHLQPHIIAVSKENIPDKAVILIEKEYIQEKLNEVEFLLPRFIDVKSGKREPHRCECCDYCKSTKVLNKVISFTEI